VIVMADELRPDALRIVERLRAQGIRHVAMVSGDRRSVSERIGREIGVDRVYAEQSPEEKLEVVRALRAAKERRPVVMVGDGINDAPALALADVGIAMGAAGATVASEAADAVIVLDRVDRVVDALRIGRRSLGIARQSVLAGMALSLVAMGFAAGGLIAPVFGALIQEAIDVTSILNALRALGSGRRQPSTSPTTDVAERFRREHIEFAPEVQRIRSTADNLETFEPAELRTELEAVRVFLCERLPQHEEEEEAAVYPVVASMLGGQDPMSSMERAHIEIEHLVRVYRQLLEDLPPSGPDRDDLVDLRRVLYGLHAILRLHFAQEEEAYAWLSAEVPVSVG